MNVDLRIPSTTNITSRSDNDSLDTATSYKRLVKSHVLIKAISRGKKRAYINENLAFQPHLSPPFDFRLARKY